jgi:hypothetical protein
MTKDRYFEMLEMLNSDPIESEIPVEFEDLYDEVQEAILVYNMLQDNWDSMNGVYLGKVLSGIKDIFDIMEVANAKSCYQIISVLDSHRGKILNKKPA